MNVLHNLKSILSDFYIKNKRLIEIFYPVFVLGTLFIIFRLYIFFNNLLNKIETLSKTLERKQELLELALSKLEQYKISREILLNKNEELTLALAKAQASNNSIIPDWLVSEKALLLFFLSILCFTYMYITGTNSYLKGNISSRIGKLNGELKLNTLHTEKLRDELSLSNKKVINHLDFLNNNVTDNIIHTSVETTHGLELTLIQQQQALVALNQKIASLESVVELLRADVQRGISGVLVDEATQYIVENSEIITKVLDASDKLS